MEPSRGRFRSDIRKMFSPEADQALNGLPRAVITAPRLSEFKEHLENALKHKVEFLGCLVQAQELMILMGHFQLTIFYDSWLNPPGDDSKVCSYFGDIAKVAKVWAETTAGY